VAQAAAKAEAKPAEKAEEAAAKAPAKAEKPAKEKKEKPAGGLPYVSNGQISVELVKSTNSCTVRQIRTVQALGLSKINDKHIHKDNPAIRGMIEVVAHLVKVEKIS
jgi:large subunit ribosomal protein L30